MTSKRERSRPLEEKKQKPTLVSPLNPRASREVYWLRNAENWVDTRGKGDWEIGETPPLCRSIQKREENGGDLGDANDRLESSRGALDAEEKKPCPSRLEELPMVKSQLTFKIGAGTQYSLFIISCRLTLSLCFS